MISEIGAPVQVLPDAVLQGIPAEQPGLAAVRREACPAAGCARDRAAIRAPENRTPPSCAATWRRAAFRFMSSRSTIFCALAADLQMVRQRSGEFHDAVVQERRPDFDGVRHAHAVHLGQDVVGKILALVEPQVGIQAVAFRGKVPQHSGQRAGQRHARPAPLFPHRRRRRSSRRAPGRRASGSPPAKRLSMYSKPIFSSETGQRRAAPQSRPQKPGGQPARAPRQLVGAIGQVSAEQLVGAFAAQRDRHAAAGQPRKEPHRQRASIGIGLVEIVGKLLDGIGQPAVGVDVELFVVGFVAGRRCGGCAPIRRNSGRRRKSKTSSAAKWMRPRRSAARWRNPGRR